MNVVRMSAASDLVLEQVEEVAEQVAALVDVGVEEHFVGAASCVSVSWKLPFRWVDLMLIMLVMRCCRAAGTLPRWFSAGVRS